MDLQHLLEGLGNLVGAGSASAVTVKPFKALYNIFGFHTFNKFAYALGVTVTTACKFNVVNDVSI